MSRSRAGLEARAKVRIRPYAASDAEAARDAALESTEQVFPWMEWCHAGYSLEESRVWIERCRSAWDRKTEYDYLYMHGSPHDAVVYALLRSRHQQQRDQP